MYDKTGATENIKILTELIGCGVFGTAPSEDTVKKLTPEKLKELYIISSEHKLAHIVGSCLEKNKLLTDEVLGSVFRQEIMTSLYRYEKLIFGFNRTCDLFEKEQIPFIPLKGAVLHNIYPEGWMRVGCDIDILVQRRDIEKVKDLFKERLNYRFLNETSHDIKMVSPDGVVFEIHHTLIEDGFANNANKILDKVWDSSRPVQRAQFHRELDEDIFYFYHIAHIAKHIENGGCGIKPVLDLYVMEKLMKPPSKELLKKGNLLQFENAVIRLCKSWFDGEEPDETTLLLQKFVLDGGVYGNRENLAYVRKGRAGGKVGYILSRIFLPYNKLKYEYPILNKYWFLFPVYTVYRWLGFIFKGNKEVRKKNLDSIKDVSKEKSSEIAELLKRVGL